MKNTIPAFRMKFNSENKKAIALILKLFRIRLVNAYGTNKTHIVMLVFHGDNRTASICNINYWDKVNYLSVSEDNLFNWCSIHYKDKIFKNIGEEVPDESLLEIPIIKYLYIKAIEDFIYRITEIRESYLQ